MIKKIKFRGQIIMLCQNRKVVKSDFRTFQDIFKEPFFYGIRHSDSDFSIPVTIEPFVTVNWWGVMKTRKPLHFRNNKDKYIVLTKKEQRHFIDAFN